MAPKAQGQGSVGGLVLAWSAPDRLDQGTDVSGLSSTGYLHKIPITLCYSSDGFRSFLCERKRTKPKHLSLHPVSPRGQSIETRERAGERGRHLARYRAVWTLTAAVTILPECRDSELSTLCQWPHGIPRDPAWACGDRGRVGNMSGRARAAPLRIAIGA